MEDLLRYIKSRIEEGEKAIKDGEECLKLAALMGIDVSEAQLRFEQNKKMFMQMKAGFENYLRQKGIKL